MIRKWKILVAIQGAYHTAEYSFTQKDPGAASLGRDAVSVFSSVATTPIFLYFCNKPTSAVPGGGGGGKCSGDPGSEGFLEEVTVAGCLVHFITHRAPLGVMRSLRGAGFPLPCPWAPPCGSDVRSPPGGALPGPYGAIHPFVTCWHHNNCIQRLLFI